MGKEGMAWHERFDPANPPTMEDIAEYVGNAKKLWLATLDFFETVYNVKPKLFYSACGMKPGWNVKFQKSGQSFGTLYPQKDALEVMVIVGYKLDAEMERVLPALSENTAELYRKAGDYMKLGKWFMLRIDDEQALEDYKKIAFVKLRPKQASA